MTVRTGRFRRLCPLLPFLTSLAAIAAQAQPAYQVKDINTVRPDEGITTGCAPNQFCPDRAVTRAEMAVFLVTAFELP